MGWIGLVEVNGYCTDLGFPNLLGKDDFIEEEIDYIGFDINVEGISLVMYDE